MEGELCMAIDRVSSQQREVELAKRLLREREEDHARETENLRRSQADQVNQLRKSQESAITRLQEKSRKDYEQQREDLTQKMSDLTDQYDRSLNEERRASYDRTGRLIDDTTRQRALENQARADQIRHLLDSHHNQSNVERQESEERIKDLYEKYNRNRTYFSGYLDHKLDEMRRANRDALSAAAEDARMKIDENIRSNSDEMNKAKLGAELRYNRLAEQSMNDRGALKQAANIREQQLIDEKGFVERKLGSDGNRALQQYRERAADNLAKTINDNNLLTAQRELQNTARLARQENDHQAKHQQALNQFRKAENELRYQNESLRNNNDLQRELDNRRHKQALFLSAEAVRAQEEQARESLKNRFSGRIEDLESKQNARFREYQNSVQQKMAEQEQRNSAERSIIEQRGSNELAKQASKQQREKLTVNNAYETQLEAAEDLRKRQLDEQVHDGRTSMRQLRHETAREIAKNNRENQTRLFVETNRFRDQFEEARMNHDLDAQALKASTDRHARQLMSAYQKSLVNQKEQFEDATQELRHESLVNLTKQKNDAEHRNRMEILELHTKNRMLVMDMEEKINRLNDDHKAEVERLNSVHEKAIRENNRRTKELLDTAKTEHERDTQAREQQSEMKLKQQESFFRQEIEKLRRTHELSIKKS